jgi:hypothetical protein
MLQAAVNHPVLADQLELSSPPKFSGAEAAKNKPSFWNRITEQWDRFVDWLKDLWNRVFHSGNKNSDTKPQPPAAPSPSGGSGSGGNRVGGGGYTGGDTDIEQPDTPKAPGTIQGKTFDESMKLVNQALLQRYGATFQPVAEFSRTQAELNSLVPSIITSHRNNPLNPVDPLLHPHPIAPEMVRDTLSRQAKKLLRSGESFDSPEALVDAVKGKLAPDKLDRLDDPYWKVQLAQAVLKSTTRASLQASAAADNDMVKTPIYQAIVNKELSDEQMATVREAFTARGIALPTPSGKKNSDYRLREAMARFVVLTMQQELEQIEPKLASYKPGANIPRGLKNRINRMTGYIQSAEDAQTPFKTIANDTAEQIEKYLTHHARLLASSPAWSVYTNPINIKAAVIPWVDAQDQTNQSPWKAYLRNRLADEGHLGLAHKTDIIGYTDYLKFEDKKPKDVEALSRQISNAFKAKQRMLANFESDPAFKQAVYSTFWSEHGRNTLGAWTAKDSNNRPGDKQTQTLVRAFTSYLDQSDPPPGSLPALSDLLKLEGLFPPDSTQGADLFKALLLPSVETALNQLLALFSAEEQAKKAAGAPGS